MAQKALTFDGHSKFKAFSLILRKPQKRVASEKLMLRNVSPKGLNLDNPVRSARGEKVPFSNAEGVELENLTY
jgi:hypothetical protein